MTTQLREAIARLRRAQIYEFDPDMELVCDALEAYLPKFDKVAYMREYMRNYRRNMSAAKRAHAQYIKAFPEEKG